MKRLVIAASCLALSGCAIFDNDFRGASRESNPAGVKGLLQGDELRFLSIAELVISFVPSDNVPNNAKAVSRLSENETPEEKQYLQVEEQKAIDRAIARYYRYYVQDDPSRAPTGALLRNEIQDRLLAAANQRCHLWKNYYASASSSVGFSTGVTAAATSAAAVAFSPVSTKNALNAISSTSTAVGTNYDKSYLFGLTLGVVYQGVDSRRANILRSILNKRVTPTSKTVDGKVVDTNEVANLGNYTLSNAIEDALEYHGACSVASGAQEAAERIADARAKSVEPPAGKESPKPQDPAQPNTGGDKKSTGAGTQKPLAQEAAQPVQPATSIAEPTRTASPASIAPPTVSNALPQKKEEPTSVGDGNASLSEKK